MSRTPAQPQYARLAMLPGLLGAIILLAALALIGGSWYLWVEYAVAILALIMCVFAAQGRQFWWLIALIPIAVIWNPVWPITLPDLVFRLLHIVGAAAFIAAGIGIRVPSPAQPGR